MGIRWLVLLHLQNTKIYWGASLSRDVFTNQIAEHAILITQEILQDLREIYEKHHQVILTKAVIIGHHCQYIADQFLRDKAIDLIDRSSWNFCCDFNPPELLDLLAKLKSVPHIEKLAQKDKHSEIIRDIGQNCYTYH